MTLSEGWGTKDDADGKNFRDNSHVGVWNIHWRCRVHQSCRASRQNGVRYKVGRNGVRSQLPQGLCDAGIPGGYRFPSRDVCLVKGLQFLLVSGRYLSWLRDSVHFDRHHADQQKIAATGLGQRIRIYTPPPNKVEPIAYHQDIVELNRLLDILGVLTI